MPSPNLSTIGQEGRTLIYLDFNATTPVDQRVLEAMLPFFREEFGNAASGQHAVGGRAALAVDGARDQVAGLLGCSVGEVVFTSGATEANNLALKGLFDAYRGDRRRVLVSATEHKAVLGAAELFASKGGKVDIVPVNRLGVVELAALAELLGPDVLVVSVMAANNETGTLNPISRIVEMAAACGALVHTDATQWVGRLPVDVRKWGVDLLSLSAHKFYGPKGVGALYARRRTPLAPLIHGGEHERGLRSGTLNVPGIVGLGEAAALAAETMAADAERLTALRDRLHGELARRLDGVGLNGHPTERLPNTVNLRFGDAEADAVMVSMPEVAVSSGSACTSAVPGPSHVLVAMGLDHAAAEESLRFSLGRPTAGADIDRAVDEVVRAVEAVRSAASKTGNALATAGVDRALR
jgi:cysteine desulfurase